MYDIDKVCVLDLACLKYCNKQLPILTLVLIFDHIHEVSSRPIKIPPRFPFKFPDFVTKNIKRIRIRRTRRYNVCYNNYGVFYS